MILIKNKEFEDENSLFFYNNFNFSEEINLDKNYKENSVKSKGDNVFLINPDKKVLEWFLLLNKNCYIFTYFIKKDIIELLKENLIKQIFVIDDKDAAILKNNSIKKFNKVFPLKNDSKVEGRPEDKIQAVRIFNNLKSLSKHKLDNFLNDFKKLNLDLPIYYHGIKKVNNYRDYELLKFMMDNNIKIRAFPFFNLEESLNESDSITIDFAEKESFPIISFARTYNSLPSIIYSDVYYRWISSEFHSLKNFSYDKVDNIILKNNELIKNFIEGKGHARIAD